MRLRNSLEVVELQMNEPALDDAIAGCRKTDRSSFGKFINLKRIRVAMHSSSINFRMYFVQVSFR